nr:hypothetical protein [Gemmatimonadota bacterium]
GYGRNYSSPRGPSGGYDRNYKSRSQTDYGDPFGDRARNTPIRSIQGGYRGYDRDHGGARDGYGRDFGMSDDRGYGATGGQGYGPAGGQAFGGAGGYPREPMRGAQFDPYERDRGPDNRSRGYDRGWWY